MDYAALIAPLAYLAAVQISTKLNTQPAFNSSLAVGLPFLVDIILAWLMIAGLDAPFLSNVFSVQALLTLLFQLIVARYVFKILQLSEGYASWLAWVIGGGVAVVYLVPMIINFLIRIF